MYLCILSSLILSSAQVHVAEKQCVKARQAVQEVEQAKSDSMQLQAQLLSADQTLHSQQQFVMTLQAAAEEAAQGESAEHDACNAGFDSVSPLCCCLDDKGQAFMYHSYTNQLLIKA